MILILKKMSKQLLAIICIISLLFSIGSCYSRKYEYDQDRQNMKSVEIVDAFYDNSNLSWYEKVLFVFDDIDAFLDELEKIKYKESLLIDSPGGIYKKSLAIKITYKNEDYEIFDAYSKSTVLNGIDNNKGTIFGSFDDEEFYKLLFKYLRTVEDPCYNLMHEVVQISSIEIVKAEIQGDTSTKCETLAVVENKEDFIEQLYNIEYSYSNDKIKSDSKETVDGKTAVKITYQNGDYEVFTHDCRADMEMMTNGHEYHSYKTYIGTFNEAAFNALMAQFLS